MSMPSFSEIQTSLPWGTVSGKAWGNPLSIPVLVVHGIQDNAGSFDNLIPLLPDGFYYICIDLPGHGKSTHFPQGFTLSLANYVEGVLRIINSLNLVKCIFIGHSLGGRIGVNLVSSFPERILKLIIIDALFSPGIPDQSFKDAYAESIIDLVKLEKSLLSKTPPDYSYDEAVNRIMSSRPTTITEVGAKTLLRRGLIKSNVGYRFSLDPRLKLSVTDLYSSKQKKNFIDNIKCPIMIIMAYDSLESPISKDTKKFHSWLYKDLEHRVEKLVEGNHNVHIDYPERVAPLISQFLIKQISAL